MTKILSTVAFDKEGLKALDASGDFQICQIEKDGTDWKAGEFADAELSLIHI